MLKIFEPLTLKHTKSRRPSQTHVVQPGETLSTIASMYGMHVMEICVLNNIGRSSAVAPGTELLVHYKPQRSRSLPAFPFADAYIEKMAKLKVDENDPSECNNLSPQPEHEEDVGNNALPWWYKASKRMKLGVIFESQPQSEYRNDKHAKKNNNKSRRSMLRSKSERLPTSQEKEKDVYALPKLIGGSPTDILSNPQHTAQIVPKLEACLPMRCRGYDWKVLYSSSQHGSSLHSLLQRVREHRSTLVLIETCDGEILGGFASSPWTNALSYYGNGESFVFSATPKFEMYSWKRSNSMFMLSNDQSIAMGGGGGFAWYLNADLSQGTTTTSETFMNRSLASTPEFDVASVEVWGFVL